MLLTIFTLVIIAAFSYIFELKDINKNITKQKIIVTSKKSEVLVELVKLSNQYEKSSLLNPEISTELNIEKQKMLQLMEHIEKLDEKKMSFKYFNTQINTYYAVLTALNDKSKKIKEKLVFQKDSIENNLKKENIVVPIKTNSPAIVNSFAKIETQTSAPIKNESASPITLFESKADIRAKKMEQLSKINITNLTVGLFNQRKDKYEPTNFAKEVNLIKINFTLPQNLIVRASMRTFYIQVLDSNDNYVGESETTNINGQKLTYSIKSFVNYKNKALYINEFLNCNDLKKGNYIVKVYDKTDLMDQYNFSLN